MLVIRETNERIARFREWTLRPDVMEELGGAAAVSSMHREIDTFAGHGKTMASDIDGWIHRRTNVHLPAAKIGEWVRVGPSVADDHEAMMREFDANRRTS